MIKSGSIYLVVKDFNKSLDFYKQLLEKDVLAQNKTRFAIFDFLVVIAEKENPGKIVVNLGTDDLGAEYERIRKLGIGRNVTDIRYINAGSPYYYFSLQDPDGNTVEITGPFEEEKYAEDKQ